MEKLNQYLVDHPSILKVGVIAGIGILVWLVLTLVKRRITNRIQDNERRYRSNKIAGFAGFAFVLVAALIMFSDQLGGITVALGVAGAGIAFALQEVIASVAGWIAISFANFYKVGDRVELGGIKGDVIDIGVLRTTVMETGQWVDGDLYNGRIVLVANSFVFKEPVFNYSGDFPFLWDEIKIPIQYGSDYSGFREMVQRIAQETVGDYTEEAKENWKGMVQKYMIENATTDPMVTLIANDNWAEFTLRYVVNFKRRRATKDILFTKILEGVEASNGAIKLASATFQLVGAPTLKVDMKT